MCWPNHIAAARRTPTPPTRLNKTLVPGGGVFKSLHTAPHTGGGRRDVNLAASRTKAGVLDSLTDTAHSTEMDGGEMDDGTSPKATMQRHRPVADDDNDTTRAADAESLPAQVGQDNAHLFVFSNSKAGMKSVDKERVNRVIYEMSKNSSYFKQAKLQDQKLDSKVRQALVKSCKKKTAV